MNSDKIYREALNTHKSGDINQAEALYENFFQLILIIRMVIIGWVK